MTATTTRNLALCDSLTLSVLADEAGERGNAAEEAALRARADAVRVVESAAAEIVRLHPDAYTRTDIADRMGEGYDAKTAAGILARNPAIAAVIVDDEAPTKRGLKLVRTSAVMYYRKSSGGKFARSVQRKFVTL